jgi:hypothetical protein
MFLPRTADSYRCLKGTALLDICSPRLVVRDGRDPALRRARDDGGASARICNLGGVVLNKRPLFRLACD